MPIYTLQGPDGKTYDVQGPDGATADQLGEFIQSQSQTQPQSQPQQVVTPQSASLTKDDLIEAIASGLQHPFSSSTPDQRIMATASGLGQGVGQVALGAEHYLGKGLQAIGADDIGGRLVDDAAFGRKNLAQQAAPYAADAPFVAGAARIAGNIAGTGPVGAALGSALKAGAGVVGAVSPTIAKLAEALRTGGVNLGGQAATTFGERAGDVALRGIGGATTGAATAGLVNPDDAETGAMIGGAFPVAGQAVASGARAVANALRGGGVSDAVAALAARAKDLGIDIPADRLVKSRPLDAVASSLNYVPFSGRSATEERMQSQMNRALSRTFGQDSDNVTMALRKAHDDLGDKFNDVLLNNTVKVDPQFTTELQDLSQRALNELTPEQAGIIQKQIDNIGASAQNGEINGRLAYNIKRTLDRIGNQNVPQAFYADDLKKSLMGALNRSLGPDDAAGFATTRQQYGNMLEMKKLAQNGAEGNVSIARVANMKHINNPDLQELADIAAQFLKPREGQHGAMQRVMVGGLGGGIAATGLGGMAMPVAAATGIALARGLNAGLNSSTARNAVLGQSKVDPALIAALRNVMPVTSRLAPVLAAQ